MALVRTYMQSGDYRRALAFCAHTAGGHGDAPAAAALYAWLLRAGGQDAVARRVLAGAQSSAPGHAVLAATAQALGTARRNAGGTPAFDRTSASPATGVMLDLPHRMAPLAVPAPGQAAPPTQARIVSSGVALSPTLVLAPASTHPRANRWWVRDGLGRTREATIEPGPDDLRNLGLMQLRLLAPLGLASTDGSDRTHSEAAVALSSRDPYAGSPGYAIDYLIDTADGATTEPGWPVLHPGFFGGQQGSGGWRRLGIDLPDGPHGGPVFDAAGGLAGIALPDGPGQATMIPASLLRSIWPHATTPAEPASTPERGRSAAPRRAAPMPADEVFERGLRVSVQILTASFDNP